MTVVGTNELGVVTDQGDGFASPVWARLLLEWALKAEDPDAQCAGWFMQGAPAMKIPPGGAFPSLLKEDDMVTLEELDEERAADLVNYEGLEESEEAAAEIAKHATAGRRRVLTRWTKSRSFWALTQWSQSLA